MAQSPENKSSSTETAPPSDTERKAAAAIGQARDTERTVASTAQAATAQATTGQATTRPANEAARQIAQQGNETLRQGAAAASEGLHAGTQATQRAIGTLADTQHSILQEISERYEAIGRRMTQDLQEAASDLRFMFVPQPGAVRTLRDLQASVAGFATNIMQSQLSAARDVLRLADPVPAFDLQRRFARAYLDTMMQGTSAFIRLARQTADQAVRPLEAHIEARQQRHSLGAEHATVSDVMTADVRVVNPDDTVQQATRLMREDDTGVLPVGEGDRLVGVVTDRDVTLRLVAEGKDPTRTKVREVMSQEIKYVFEDEDLAHVADNMAEQQVRRLPVLNRNKRLVGVLSLGDLARAGRSGNLAGKAMRGIAAE